jgi:hypothetical protein
MEQVKMTTEKQTRNTKKSRMVAEFCEAIVDCYVAGENVVTKTDIINTVIDTNLGHEASPAIRTMMEDELANELERYFRDAVKCATDIIDRPHHLITNKYFKWEKALESKYTAEQCVAAFGNGRGAKAVGVRFVPEGVEDDPLWMIATEKNFNTMAAGVNTRMAKLNRQLDSQPLDRKLEGRVRAAMPAELGAIELKD